MNILRERKGNGWAQIVRQCGALVGYSMDAAPQTVMQSIPKPAVPSEDSIPQIHSAAPRNANARSMASISSEGSTESQTPLMEQEDIAVLTHDVRNFKEALGKLRRTLNREQENQGPQRIMAHEKLGEVLRILRNVLEKYPALQSPELLLSASTLIQHVKGYAFEDTKADPKPFFELIDQLALAFSSRVSEYLMGDLDTNILISNLPCNKNKSCDNLAEDIPEGVVADETVDEKKEDVSQCHLIDEALLNLEQGVEFALNCAKVWSKYVKDILMYVEKRCHLEMEYTRNLNKLALTVRPLINEEVNLPFQSIYCTALDHDIDNSNSSQTTCNLLLGKKFLEPLSERRIEHEKERRQLKEQWFWEVSRMRDVVLRMRQTYGLYIQRQRDAERRPADEDTVQKAVEAEASYKASISDANESHKRLYVVKNDILQRVRTLLAESDSVLRTVTVAYFQLQLTLNNPISIQFQTLCESSRLYEPGSQYVEAIKRLPPPAVASLQTPFTLGKYLDHQKKISDQEHKSNDSIEGEDLLFQGLREPTLGSDTDSIASAPSSHDADTSLSTTCRSPPRELMSVLDTANDNDVRYMSLHPSHRHSMSKAAVTHSFRKLKTPSRCRECDSYVYFQGVDCSECGLACHKKCLETLAIQCGHKRLPRKMTTFGVDLAHHLGETSTLVPHIVCKCIDEIDARGRLIKGIYRVSGVKSKVEKLCQAFENGADLVDLTDIHPNVIANVLKLYLRQLPEPLLTFRLYPEFVRVAKECPSNSPAEMAAAREDLKELVKKLSKQHYLTLALLMLHLKRVSNDSEVNNMPPSNMGIVFGPTLLRTAEGSASLSSLVDTVHQTRAIELLITHSEEIFNSQEVALAREHSLRMARPASEGGLLGRSFSFMDRSKKNKEYESSLSVAADETDFMHTASNPSEDEISFFLTMDGPGQSKASPQLSRVNPTPKIFKGSLKDYQGLECISLSSLGMKTEDSEHFHQKLKKCVSDSSSRERTTSEISESMSSNRTLIVSKNTRESEKVNVVSRSSEECYDSVFYEKHSHATETSKSMSKNMSSVQRTESCADSDCSFESHASSIDSCSPREMEDSSEVLLELPATWTKKHSPSASSGEIRQKLLCRESPCSSLSHSLDESQGSDKVEDMDVAIRRSMSTLHGTHSRTQIQTSTMIGFQEEENISKAHQSVTSSVGCTARETVHQAHKKAAIFEGTNVDMKGKTRQVMMSHEEECGVHLEKVMADFTKKLHDSTDV